MLLSRRAVGTTGKSSGFGDFHVVGAVTPPLRLLPRVPQVT